ncbi:MAG: Heptosyltransferase [Planctomycetaceae bacterium]|nr:Heptosyltransferase [Planctomycetaceae bacterium]
MSGMDAADFNSRVSRCPIRRICIIKPSAFGDVVQSMPLLNVLHSRFPESQISWVINRELSDLLTGHSVAPKLIPFDRRGGVSAWWKLLRDIRQSKFDLVVDLQGLFRTSVMSWASRAPLRVGLQAARDGSSLACHLLVPNTSSQGPAHRRYWQVAEELGLGQLKQQAGIAIPDSDSAWAARVKANLSGPLLVIHPGARWKTKQWPISHFSVVARQALRDLKMSAVVIGSRGESAAAEELVAAVKREVPRGEILSLAGQTSIKQLSALLQKADLVLSNDSGPMHLAAAMGTPVVGVFTCTSSERSGPAGNLHRFVAADVPCAASYCKQCPHRGDAYQACFRQLTPGLVWTALRDHWNFISPRRRVA